MYNEYDKNFIIWPDFKTKLDLPVPSSGTDYVELVKLNYLKTKIQQSSKCGTIQPDLNLKQN